MALQYVRKAQKMKDGANLCPGFRNQPSCCLFRTSAFVVRPSNWRETIRSSKQLRGLPSLETAMSARLRSPN